MECVLHGERSLLMQFSMKMTGFIGNKGPVITDGIEQKIAAVWLRRLNL